MSVLVDRGALARSFVVTGGDPALSKFVFTITFEVVPSQSAHASGLRLVASTDDSVDARADRKIRRAASRQCACSEVESCASAESVVGLCAVWTPVF